MSSILATGVAENASIVAQSTPHAPQRAEAGTSQPPSANQVVNNAQAAVVSLSVESRNRTASSGDNRQVDASFDKQEIREKKDKQQSKGPKRTVDVAA